MSVVNVGEVAVLAVGDGQVPETLEVLLELRHAVDDVAVLIGAFKTSEIKPRGLVSIIGSYDSYLFGCDSGWETRTWVKTEENKEEEGTVT